jgi:hypothetical protein
MVMVLLHNTILRKLLIQSFRKSVISDGLARYLENTWLVISDVVGSPSQRKL